MTLCASVRETRVSIIHFVRRSSANTTPARPTALTRGSSFSIGIVILDGLSARGADRGKFAIRSHIRGVFPAALALYAGGALHSHRYIAAGRGFVQRYLGDDEEAREFPGVFFEERI